MRFKQIILIKGNRSCLPSLLKTIDHIILVNFVYGQLRASVGLIRLYESFAMSLQL
jgi:hypothetical protein